MLQQRAAERRVAASSRRNLSVTSCGPRASRAPPATSMDSELTAGFTEACGQCEAVDWGVSEEGRFFCRSCHNVIERRKEVEERSVIPRVTRITRVRASRSERRGAARAWSICEAFQFILRNQAAALLRLGVSPTFKDQVLLPLWRRYLQVSRLAYTSAPIRTAAATPQDSGSEFSVQSSAASSAASSGEDSDRRGSESGNGVASGVSTKQLCALVSMTKTLALIHLALVWCRESLTLSDLLRLVSDGHVPYINAYEGLPEEMQPAGPDMVFFRVKDVPSYRCLHAEAQAVAHLLELPAFPPISCQSRLHPATLALRYMTEANLPDELHPWALMLVERGALMDEEVHTYGPSTCRCLPPYDIQAAAVVIITMKLLFGLDDRTEWELSSSAGDQDPGLFSFRRWYRVLQAALFRARQSHRLELARRRWKSRKPLCTDRKSSMKNTRTAEHIQNCFQKLSDRTPEVQQRPPSSFRFLWGDQDGADGPSMHHQRLGPVVNGDPELLTPTQQFYWYFHLKPTAPRICRRWDTVLEKSLPHSLRWLLEFFCFLLQVPLDLLYPVVLKLERWLLKSLGQKRTRKWTRTRAPPSSTSTS
ncbi:TATA box-binding protein-associated factor RNA polymerase I subunit B [Synchiropus splendidus]|uniref:TATA box-binding protein-associated factor RNA polymerase I subunit B n=1 Tax=Synchiropus splendidus TaxID=270530 RepID=UPI00237D99B2|nr:TATA box-binding protein-associated factor RNA polymerase I subunit B [Synchiropus splendidus]